MIKIKDVKPGLKIVGHVVWDNGRLTEREFTWGTPMEVTRVEFSHSYAEHNDRIQYDGAPAPTHDYYRVYARPHNGEEQSIGVFGVEEGLLPV